MKKLTSVWGIIAFGVIAAACSGHATTTVRRETVQTAPGDPVVVEKRTTIQGGTVERRTTDTTESKD